MITKNSKDPFSILEAITDIGETNPFGVARPVKENQFLETDHPVDPLHRDSFPIRAQVTKELLVSLEEALDEIAPSIRENRKGYNQSQKELYRNGVWFWIYHQHLEDLDEHLETLRLAPDEEAKISNEIYTRFRDNLGRFLLLQDDRSNIQDSLAANSRDVAELFGFCFQLRRGLHGIVDRIIGSSAAVIELRSAIWEAIFTRRLVWSFQYLKDRMANFSTLILGDSGTGKDMVAEIIGGSQFIPFNTEKHQFEINPFRAYRAVNLSALTPTLIESELFGHVKGAFTGAASPRKGHLELCSPYGALFLDEIGDLSPEIQVKLLRVLQSREFYPLGGERLLHFQGRILSATNRDIDEIIGSGQMREDFLYRIGANVIRVPSLDQRFTDNPKEAEILLGYILERILGLQDAGVFKEIRDRIRTLVAEEYSWPGNVREFEQCIRSLLVSSEFHPLVKVETKVSEFDSLFRRMETGEASLDEVLQRYCLRVLEQTGTYQKAGEQLGVDWRTIKKHAGGNA